MWYIRRRQKIKGLPLKRISLLLKTYPLPPFVLSAILLGAFFFFNKPDGIWAHRIWFATLILGGLPIVYGTIKGMLKGQFASDIVAMLAIITAVFLNEAFAGAVVVLMQSGGEAIERYGFRKASSSLEELFKRAPRKARRKTSIKDQLEEIDVNQVQIGDIIIVRPGEMIPVDGTVILGTTQIDESAITGEPLDKEKEVGSKLLSGSVNISGAIEMRADKKSEESQYVKIVKLVQKAQEEKAPIQRLADRYAILFTPLTLIMALIGYLMTFDFVTVLAVLVVATPCPLILATPLAVICGINQAAKEGIIVKGGSAIEQIGSADAILFDKTGTITFGTPIVEAVIPFGEVTKEDLLYHAASIEQLSTHSLAKAIVAEWLKQSKTLPLPNHFQEVPGQGVSGEIGGHTYTIGSSALLKEKLGKDCVSGHEKELQPYIKKSSILISIFKDETCIGVLVLTDHIRPNVPQIIQNLKALGIKEMLMITGDNNSSAEMISKESGINAFVAELFPEQKVAIVEEFKKKYSSLVMVGDGINDAPALATATVGIAMGAHGTAISAEAANIVLLVDDLSKVVNAITIGKRMLYIAKQSIFVGIGLSFLLMILAALGLISPPFGALLQEIIDVTVILNALRVLKK